MRDASMLSTPDIELIWISRHEWKAGRRARFEAADRWVFWLVRQGSLEATLDGRPHRVTAGQACLQKAGMHRELCAETAACWDSIGFRLRPHPQHAFAARANIWRPNAAEHALLDATFPLLRQWRAAGTEGAARSAASALQTLLSLSLEQAPLTAAPPHPPWLQLALERLEAAPRQDLTALSREAGYSPAQFRARFQEFTGYAPRAYAAACLDRQARHALLTTDFSVEQIALQLGFTATAHFIRFFKRGNGTTPARFRRGDGGA